MKKHLKHRAIFAVIIAVLLACSAFTSFGDTGAGGADGAAFGSAGAGGAAQQQGADETHRNAALLGLTDEQVIDELTASPAKGAEYDGYLVKLADGALDGGGVDAKALKKNSECVIGGEIAKVDEPKDALKFADAKDIELIEPNYKYTAFAFPQTDPADPYYANEWGVKYVKAQAAWQAGYRGQGVNIAIIDTGIVKGHEDLRGDKILEEWDWVNGDSNAADDQMHGSVVGGIISAEINNYGFGTTTGVGMAGIADQSSLIIHKGLDRNGEGGEGIFYALYDILQDGNRIDVLNMSLGGPGYSDLMNDLIQRIIKKGTIVVAATGNEGDVSEYGSKANQMNYPAGYAGVIGVGSIGRNGQVSSFSTKNSSVDVAAPGEEMVGLEYGTIGGYYVNRFSYGGKTYSLDGTSFACPVVAAAAAFAKQRDKNINASAFLAALKATSDPAGLAGYDVYYGNGILNIDKLINYLNTRQVTVTFNANGGKVSTKSRAAWPGGTYGSLPTPKRGKYGFGGWYTKKKGGSRVTALSTVGGANVTLYAHWQGGTTLQNLAASKGKLSPAFKHTKTSYKLTLAKSQSSTKITATKAYPSAKLQIQVGSGKFKTKSAQAVKLARGKSATVYVKLSCKGMKTKVYKIKVSRKK